jgi:nicotinic acid mononucleotide adenylyltransferase
LNNYQKENAMQIAVFGGSFNPPGIHHREAVIKLREVFPLVIVVPCSSHRTDKTTLSQGSDWHRKEMCQKTFGDIPGVQFDFVDLESGHYTRTWRFLDRYKHLGEVWLYVGSDLLIGGRDNNSVIQREWERGVWLWQHGNFAVSYRSGYSINELDLPPNAVTVAAGIKGSSTEIRQAIAEQNTITGVVPEVAEYIRQYRLYGYHAERVNISQI